MIINASDGEYSISTEFIVTVLPINDPPELIGEIQDITVFENSENIEIQLSEIFYDVEDGSNLVYSISENIEGLIVYRVGEFGVSKPGQSDDDVFGSLFSFFMCKIYRILHILCDLGSININF